MIHYVLQVATRRLSQGQRFQCVCAISAFRILIAASGTSL
jgi:hypothetical protein